MRQVLQSAAVITKWNVTHPRQRPQAINGKATSLRESIQKFKILESLNKKSMGFKAFTSAMSTRDIKWSFLKYLEHQKN